MPQNQKNPRVKDTQRDQQSNKRNQSNRNRDRETIDTAKSGERSRKSDTKNPGSSFKK
jgi:hypothetical protein